MDQWWTVVFEWVNCLQISDVKVKEKFDLQDGYIFKKIIQAIGVWRIDCSTNEEEIQHSSEDDNNIISFIKDEYPEFSTSTENRELYLASLFLLRASQEPEFQKPMATNLHHETQIKIKAFLETLLPYGRHVTADILEMAITEIIDDNPTNRTPRKRPLREFFTSPAAVSAQKQRIVNERDRQIRHLKSELETERCEKAYLQDDLRNREEKIKNLQAKLQMKSDELKSMREERMSSYTPQSCKKSRDSMELVYKKEIESLENFISNLQKDCEKMESEKDALTQTISMMKIKLESCENKSSHFEKQAEMLLTQMELKDREIVDLRIQNEEFRTLIKEMKDPVVNEQSFECDEVMYNKNRASLNLNTSEVLSSVVEVQLQEVQKECDKLRVELETAMKNLNNANMENRGLRFTNEILKEKVENLDQLSEQLRNAQDSLKTKASEVSRLENELMVLTEEFKHVKEQIVNKDKTLEEAEQTEKSLKNELNKLTARLQILEESMRNEIDRTNNVKSAFADLEQDRVILSEKLKMAEDNLMAKEVSLTALEESEKSLKNDVNKYVAKIQVLEDSQRKEKIKYEELAECLSAVERQNLVLEEKSRVLEKQFTSTEETLKKADAQVLILTQEVKNISLLLNDEKLSNKQLTDEIVILKEEKKKLLDNLNSMELRVDNQLLELKERAERIQLLEKQLEDINSYVDTLKKSLQEEKEIACDLKETVSRLTAEKDNILYNLKDIESKLIREKDLLAQSNELNKNLEKEKCESQENLENVKKLLLTEKHLSDELKSEIEILRREKSLCLEKLEDVENKLVTTTDLLQQAKENIEQRNKDNLNLENSLKKMEEFLAGERSEKAYLQTIIEKLENREQSLSENLNVVKTELNEKLQSLLSAMEDISKLKSEVSNLESIKHSLEENLKIEKLNVNDLQNSLTLLEKEHKQTIEENTKVKEDVKKYEHSIGLLNKKVENLEKKLSNKNEDLKLRTSSFEELEEAFDILKTEKEELVLKSKNNELIVQTSETEIRKLNEQITLLNDDYDSALNDLKLKVENINNLNAVILKLESTLKEKEILIEELNKKQLQFESAQRSNLEWFKNIISEGSEIVKSNFNISINNFEDLGNELRNLLISFQKSTEFCNNNIKSQEKEIKEKINEITNLRSDISALEEKIENMTVEIINLKKEITAKEKLLADSEKQESNLQKTLEETKETFSVRIKNLESKLSKSVDESSIKISALESEKSTLEKELFNCSQELSLVTADNKTLKNEKLRLNEQLTEYSKEISDIEEMKSELLSEKLQLKKQLDQCSKELSDCSIKNKSLEDQIKRLEVIKSEQESKILNIQTELNQVLHDMKVLENTKEILEKQNESQMNEVLTKIKYLKTENVQLNSNIVRLTEECVSLKDQLAGSVEKNGLLSEQVRQLEIQINALASEVEAKEKHIKKISEEDNRAKTLIENMEKQLSESQNNYEELMINIKLKENSLSILQQKIESIGKEKLESELKLKEVISNMDEVRIRQDAVLQTQDKAIKEKVLCIEELQKDRSRLESHLKEEKSKNVTIEEKCRDLESNLKSEKNSHNEIKMLLQQCQLELKSFKDECNEMKLLKNELDSDFEKLYKALEDLDNNYLNSMKEREGEKEESISRTDSSVKIINLLKENLEVLTSENQTLKEEVLIQKEALALENNKLHEQVQQLEINKKNHNELLSETLKKTELFQMLLSLAMKLRHEFDVQLENVEKNWVTIETKYESVLTTSRQSCDSLRKLLLQKADLDKKILGLKQSQFEDAYNLLQAMHKSILWTEKKLKNGISSTEDENFDSIHDVSLNTSFSNDETAVNADIERNKLALQSLQLVKDKIEVFVQSVEAYNEGLKTGEIKLEPIMEEKLKIEVEKLNTERKDLKDKLNNMRTRNAKLEKNIDGLRSEIKLLKESQATKIDTSEVDLLNQKIQELEIQKEKLEKSRESLEKEKDLLEKLKEEIEKEKEDAISKYKEELEKKDAMLNERMQEIHKEYGNKLDLLKQKMKTAFNEQMTKLKQEQEKTVEEKIQSLRVKMEQQCRKHTEEINKYKNHVSELSTQYWDVGEKLIFEKQEKEQALQQLKNIKEKLGEKMSDQLSMTQKTMSLDRRDFSQDRDSLRLKSIHSHSIQAIEEETVSRRHSVRSIQAMGNPFNAEDEEGEIFDSIYLADMKECRSKLPPPDLDRLSVLQRRNTLCKPHLKSSYPAETQFQPMGFSEEDIKTGGGTEEIFNDSLSQSLLPGQKLRKRDRTQPSYKKPGPPTPSKNGGRLSLQGNELPKSPSSRVLKERNIERKTTTTPRRLMDLFSTSKKQDENGTPRSRRLTFFGSKRSVKDNKV